jgi:uncharacterized caspase-like protein
MRQWAIAIGINHYQFFQPLSYAQQDAHAIHHFLTQEAGFSPEHCILLTENSPPVWGRTTYPDRATIESWLELLIQEYVEPQDSLWVFFSGYGVAHQGQDYLLPIGANPAAILQTAIPIATLLNKLKSAQTPSMLLLLDMNRSQGALSSQPIGVQTAQLATASGIPTILSCQPGQFSYETAGLNHGLFTAGLLESLRAQPGANLAVLGRHLRDRLTELSDHYWRPQQHPLIICPPNKMQQVLLPQQPTAAPAWSLPPLPVAVVHAGQRSQLATEASPNRGMLKHFSSGTPTVSASQSDPSLHQNGHRSLPSGNGNGSNDPQASQPVPPLAPAPGNNGYPASPSRPENNIRNVRRGNGHYPPQPPPPPPATVPAAAAPTGTLDDADLPDTWFWQSSYFWGGIAVAALLLILGVLLKNWKALSPMPMVDSQNQLSLSNPANPDAPAPASNLEKQSLQKPEAGSGQTGNTQPGNPGNVQVGNAQAGNTGNTQPDNLQAGNAQAGNARNTQSGNAQTAKLPILGVLVQQARETAMLRTDQASPFSDAIRKLRDLPSSHPEYEDAQLAIAEWSKDIMTIAKRRATQKSFDNAILAARLVPETQPVYAEVRTAIAQWCPLTRLQPARNPIQRQRVDELCRGL